MNNWKQEVFEEEKFHNWSEKLSQCFLLVVVCSCEGLVGYERQPEHAGVFAMPQL